MVACNEVHVFGSETRLSSLDVSAYVLFCLSKGATGAHDLCRTLTKCLRYEHTTEGIRVFVNGVENDFCLCTSPEEMKLKLLENKYASILIQCCFRKAIAKRKFRNIALKDQKQRYEKMNKAAIEVCDKLCVIFINRPVFWISSYSFFVWNYFIIDSANSQGVY
jgi:hypothetical protein